MGNWELGRGIITAEGAEHAEGENRGRKAEGGNQRENARRNSLSKPDIK